VLFFTFESSFFLFSYGVSTLLVFCELNKIWGVVEFVQLNCLFLMKQSLAHFNIMTCLIWSRGVCIIIHHSICMGRDTSTRWHTQFQSSYTNAWALYRKVLPERKVICHSVSDSFMEIFWWDRHRIWNLVFKWSRIGLILNNLEDLHTCLWYCCLWFITTCKLIKNDEKWQSQMRA
jgi:hypothetical protein